MAQYKLILTTDGGEVVNSWRISTELDFDTEDLSAEPNFDSYITKGDFEAGRVSNTEFEVDKSIANHEGWERRNGIDY